MARNGKGGGWGGCHGAQLKRALRPVSAAQVSGAQKLCDGLVRGRALEVAERMAQDIVQRFYPAFVALENTLRLLQNSQP
ncbi:MAG: hypothetical protein RLZZ352_36 [Pseudomonadota bacterium]|jgi:hypothetical protein